MNRNQSSRKTTVEIEVKFYLANPARLQDRLVSLGIAASSSRVLEQNWRYDDKQDSLSASDRVLRLRRDQKVTMTYKAAGKKGSEVAEREEIEIRVSDIVNTRKILTALGFHQILIYEKYRTTYQYQDCEITLDEMPYGTFCEIEGESTKRIRATADKLKLNWNNRITDSYTRLFENLKRAKGFKFRDLTFVNFRGRSVTASDLGVLPAD